MQLKYISTVCEPASGAARVQAICFAPNGQKLAVCSADRVISLYDENGVKRDKFATKPIDAKVGVHRARTYMCRSSTARSRT
jgi:intraflagellar transport protein 172